MRDDGVFSARWIEEVRRRQIALDDKCRPKKWYARQIVFFCESSHGNNYTLGMKWMLENFELCKIHSKYFVIFYIALNIAALNTQRDISVYCFQNIDLSSTFTNVWFVILARLKFCVSSKLLNSKSISLQQLLYLIEEQWIQIPAVNYF
jgi:hypothetical protein